MDKLGYLKKLEQIGVNFSIGSVHQCGGTVFHITPLELIEYEKDPEFVTAAFNGVSKSNYISWINSGYNAYCSGKTAKGTPCKNILTGGFQLDAEKWASMQGSLCHLHLEKEF